MDTTTYENRTGTVADLLPGDFVDVVGDGRRYRAMRVERGVAAVEATTQPKSWTNPRAGQINVVAVTWTLGARTMFAPAAPVRYRRPATAAN